MPLSPTEKKKWREQLVRFCLVAHKYDQRWHYTQQRPYTGLGDPASDTHYNDCSSYLAIAFYKAGYTYMKRYKAPADNYRVGDVALFLDPGSFGDHVIFCIEEGDGENSAWTSFGGEAGPMELRLHYRHDLTGVYRPEDLR
jgi:hypothetical protein